MDKETTAIMRLQEASQMSLAFYEFPLVITISGGKDSSVCLELAKRAKIPYEVVHNHTTADAPETVYFIRRDFERIEAQGIKCTLNYPIYKGKRTSIAIIRIGGIQLGEELFQLPKPQKRRKP